MGAGRRPQVTQKVRFAAGEPRPILSGPLGSALGPLPACLVLSFRIYLFDNKHDYPNSPALLPGPGLSPHTP